MLDNGHLQIRGIKKADEGVYNCEARVAARGEIDYKKITVVVNGELWCCCGRRLTLRQVCVQQGRSSCSCPHLSSLSFSLSYRPCQAVGGQRYSRRGRVHRVGVRRRRLS